ncbi:MAG: ABC transporter substrate-binding protein, partial [Trichodesmium sp. MAG_R03]|nr:ABC transporter substrate-binding protein [Trichodesmium sp. MAG_R03]
RSEIWELEKLDDEANNYYEGADKWRIRGDIDRELEHYNMALELNPNHFSALFQLAAGYKKKQRFQAALELYERVYRIHPQRGKEEYIELLFGYGDHLIQENGSIETNLSAVKKLYETVLKIEPYNMEAQEKLKDIKDKEYVLVYVRKKSKKNPIRNVFLTAALAAPLLIGIGIFWGLKTQQDPDFILGKSELDQLEIERFSSGEKRIFDRYNNTDDDDNVNFIICNGKFKNSNYKKAVSCFQELVTSNGNDPEPLIYYNNSLARENNNNPLKIAVVVPADNNSQRAKAILRGVAQAQNEYNKNYYFSGNSRLLEIIIVNDSNDDKISPKVAQGIVRDKEILGVIGHNSSDATKAALEVYEKEKLAVISSTSTSRELKGDTFFRTVIDDSVASKKLAEYVKLRSIEKIVIFYNKESSFSKSINGFFDFYLTTLKPDIKVKSIDLKQSSFDLNKEVRVAANNQVEAGALFANIGTIDLAIEVAKANFKLPESQRLKLIAGDSFYNCDILDKGGEPLKGLILSIPWHKQLDTAKEFVARAKEQWGGEVGWRTATS